MSAPSTVLVDASVRVISEGQAPSGAYVASPNFSQYGFAWLRDGAYCALAMDAVGERESAARFHRWATDVVLGERDQISRVVAALDRGDVVTPGMMLPTRYTLDGEREGVDPDDAWPNFQLDGYGTWLFALERHMGDASPDDETSEAVELAASYLAASWRMPCYDYWEEFGDRLHTSTLAAIAAGLRAAGRILGREAFMAEAAAIMEFVHRECVVDGAFVKGPDDPRVDASLLSLATPFQLVGVEDPLMRATVKRIRSELVSPTGGVRRYVGDTYFGGSPWLLLTAWLGWHLRIAGDEEGYLAARAWVEGHAGASGWMAEQITDEPQDPASVAPWVERWGTAANPLLWSHAKYLLMESEVPA
jgi:GH15 family glucan-1,4-alpha-glucosidase